MSLLDGNTTVLVQRYRDDVDADLNPTVTVDGPPVSVSARVFTVSAEESAALGFELNTSQRVYARSWPGDARSRVIWRGRTWDTVGEPQRKSNGIRTGHVSVLIRTTEAPLEA